MDLEQLRWELGAIDRRLVESFLKRMELVNQVAEYKAKNKGHIFVPEQEVRVLARIRSQVPHELEASAEVLWRTLMRLSRQRQYEYLLELGQEWRLGKELKEASCEPSKVHKVAITRVFGDSIFPNVEELYPHASFLKAKDLEDACLQVVIGRADIAFLPYSVELPGVLEKHALFIQACLELQQTKGRMMAVGSTLTLSSKAKLASLLIHTQDDKTCLERAIGILGDHNLGIYRLEPVESGSYYLEFQVNLGVPLILHALYQIEQETPKMHFLGWY